VLQATHDAVLEILITFVTAKTSSIFFWPVDQRGQNLNITIPEPLPIYSGSFTMISPQSCYQLNNNASKNDTSPAFSTAQVAMASVDLLSKDDVSSYCMATTLQSRDLRSFEIRFGRHDSIRKWRADSKILNRCTCQFCRRTINNTHCSTTNFNRFGIATGIFIEFN